MGNTVFYRDVKKNPNKITFKEIFSDCTKKHSRRDFDYQLSAGMDFNKASESDMLQKWQKPWLFYRLFIICAILTGIIVGFYKLMPKLLDGLDYGTAIMVMFVIPMFVPFIVAVFFWEMNIPRNIALYEVVLSIIVGGSISFFANMVINKFGSEKLHEVAYAGVYEEPAKLIAALIIIAVLLKGKKIYGLTGIVIGGAVGAGFSAFESISYVFSNLMSTGDLTGMAKFYFQSRFLGAFAGHLTRAAAITGAVTLHAEKNKITLSSFLNSDFIIMIVATITTHFINNSDDVHIALNLDTEMKYYIFKTGLDIVEWFVLLYILRKCLYQAVARGRYASGEGIGYTQAVGAIGGQMAANAQMAAAASVARITVMSVDGAIKGAVWQSNGGEVLTIGRDDGNVFKLPPNIGGISRKHCVIKYTSNGWVVVDLNSSYGTSVNQVKIPPNTEQPLREGDVINLGGSGQAFKISYKS